MRLHRSSNKVFSGVLAGLAEYFGWDVTLTRLIYAAIFTFTGFLPGLILYIIAAIIMPEE